MSLNTGIAQTALNSQGLAELRRSANLDKDDQETLRQVAGQFESLFLNMMLKSMRQASLAEGVFDSSQSNMYRDMADQQLSMDLSARGGLGLQEVIMRQLGGHIADKADKAENVDKTNQGFGIDTVTTRNALPIIDRESLLAAAEKELPALKASLPIKATDKITFGSPEGFVRQLWSMAEKAAQKIGVSPEVILSQAALETGWGKHVIAKTDQKSSHNLFNIKADARWDGETATIGTVEYRDGVAVKEQAKFRVYESYQDSFNDYINFLQTQPRYQDALKSAAEPEAFIDGLHKAGYATDPAYADKIKHIMNSDTLAQVSPKSAGS